MITDKDKTGRYMDMVESFIPKDILNAFADEVFDGTAFQPDEIKTCAEWIWLRASEQARKEAAERAVRFFDDFRICVPPNKYNMPQETLEQLRSAILGDTVKEGKTDAEKLDIAVKALEYASISLAKTDGDYGTLCVVREALKEIQ